MADGSIKIAVEVDGKQVDVASKSLDNLEASGQEAGQGVKQAEEGLKGVGNESNKASGNIKKIATALGLVAIGAAAFNVLRNSMDDAISRFDTLNSFPKVMEQVGFSADESERAISRLSDGIDGLPTKLDDVASTAQQLAVMTGDLEGAVETTLALNNAFLASGASTADAERGLQQYVQMLSKGEVDLQSWRTLQETMGVALNDVAVAFGFAGASAQNDLYAALQDGHITFDEFNAKLVELSNETGGFADRAQTASSGIATSLGNLRNAAARGIANIIESFDKLSKEVTGKDIAQNIDGLKNIVNASFKVIGNVIEGTTPIIIFFADGVKMAIPVVKTLTPAIIGLMTAFAAYAVITKASTAIQASNAVLKIAMASTTGLTLATKAHTTASVANAGAVKLSTLVIGLMTGKITLSAAAMAVKTAATYALGTALRFLSGPVGWVTAGIGALTGAAVAVVAWFKRSSEESKKLQAETEELGESTNSLTDNLNSTSEAYKNSQNEIKATAEANQDLANRVEDLAEKENKSAAEKQMLAQYVEQLNGQIEGLNLAYNDEADALSMSSEELQARVDLMKEQEAGMAAQERLLEISKEQNEVDMQLNEINDLKAESVRLEEEGAISKSDHKDAIADLDEQEKALTETKAQLAEQQVETEAQLTASMEAITEATESGVNNQKIAFEDLSESQQATVESMKSTWEDYKNAATDMFDTLSDEAELTVQEMTANLEENQRIIGDWATNIATLAERGVDEGLLNTLREAGPESAGHVNALVNASDEELAGLSEAFANGGDTATDALSKSLGIEESGVLDAVGHLVTDTEQALAQQIQSAGFDSIGNDVADGLAGGIEAGTAGAVTASTAMADDTTNAAKAAFQTRSPSRVFKGIGGDVVDGLALGISQGTAKVTQAIQKMFKAVEMDSTRSFQIITRNYDRSVEQIGKSLDKLPRLTQTAMRNMLNRLRVGASQQVQVMRTLASNLRSPFNSTPSQFMSIGLNSMAGLNAGLNAGSGRVMSTARSIANRVASTMKSALRIHSPSRLMRDDVGKMVPEGIALGIRDNAKSVYDEINKLSSGMIMTSTPEQALGTNRMAYNAGSQFVDAFKNVQAPSTSANKSVDQDEKQPAIINVHVGNKQIASEIVDDITNLQNRKSKRKRRYPRGGGAFA